MNNILISDFYSEQVEIELLGYIIYNGEQFVDLVNDAGYDTSLFYNPQHQQLYKAILDCYNNNFDINLLTVSEKYPDAYKFRYQYTTAPSNLIKILKQLKIKRSLLENVQKLYSQIVDEDALDVLAAHETLTLNIRDGVVDSANKLNPLKSLSRSRLNTILEKQNAKNLGQDVHFGYSTGFSRLDEYTLWENDQLIIIAARPMMGKTSFGLNSVHTALKNGFVCYMASLEMGANELAQRLLLDESEVNSSLVKRLDLKGTDINKLERAQQAIENLPGELYVNDNPSITVSDMRSDIRRVIQKSGRVDLIIVDYLQLVNVPKYKSFGLREQEVAFISRELKKLSKEFHRPVLALTQLNRASLHRDDFVPSLSDLRESGQIEQDADTVIFIHRPEVFGIEIDDEGYLTKNVAHFTIAKQRNGPTNVMVRLKFVPEFTRFEDILELNKA